MTAGIRGNKAYRGISHAERQQLASILLAALNFSHIRILGGDVDVMQKWFEEAKLGIFIHYGIYAVDGVAILVLL